ncbi:ABC transporter substrate-binding protein [Planococcus sp. 1R117A]|uniref:ABC transporter substrate-binding protein n=1 Tax=Planococcus sp. 1R117A TaxID=3447020 RepID=UPI003EDC07D7
MQTTQLKFLIRLFLLLALTFIVSACSSKIDSEVQGNNSDVEDKEGTPQKGGEITIGYETDIANFDPIKSTGGINFPLLLPVYDTLIRFTPELEPEPGLAESWKFLDDKTLELTLRKNVKFHDGTPFDAEAVKFNIDRTNSEHSTVSELMSIESVDVIDTHTVNLNLSKPDSSIVLGLSHTGGLIVSPTAVKKYGENYSQNPVGTGPFKMAKHVPNGEIIFEANEDYWQEELPYLDKLTVKIIGDETTRINALKSGEIDFAENISPGNVAGFENNESFKVEKLTSLPFKNYYLNPTIEPLNNKAVRQAINHGINREAMVQAINFGIGEPAYQPFPSNYWASDKNLKIKYDPEKSKKLLKEAGLENVSFEMVHHSTAYDQRIAEAIKSQLKEVGIQVDLRAMEQQAALASFWSEKESASFLGRWSARPDPQSTMGSLFSVEDYYNLGHSTDEIESLILEAGMNYNQDERAELYKEISRKAVLEEAIIIPLFFTPRTAIMNSKLNGYVPNMLEKPVLSTIWVED